MKLESKKVIYIGFAFLIICMFWQVYDNIIGLMLINTFGFNQFWSGAVLALDNLLALLLLPLFGYLSDRTNSKMGKRTPYVLFGVIISAILFIGVAVADYNQQQNVEEANLPDVVTIIDVDDGEIGFRYRDQDFLAEDYNDNIRQAQVEAQLARRADIRELSNQNVGNIIFFIVVLFFVLVTMSVYRSPAVALMPDVVPKPLRSKANAIINLMGVVGGVIAIIMMMFLAENTNNYIPTFVVLAVLMIVFLGLFMWKVKEHKFVDEGREQSKLYGIEDDLQDTSDGRMSPAVRRSFYLILASIIFWFMAYNAAISKFSVYAENILDMGFTLPLLIAQITAIIAFLPIGIIASKVGRKKTILVGVVILAAAFTLGAVATSSTTFLIFVTMGVAGIGWATINVNSYPMIVEMAKGNNIGKFTGIYYTASMSAQIATPMLSGWIMDNLLGYEEMRLLFPYSVIFCILAFGTMLGVKHGDSKPIPKSKIEIFADPEELEE